MSLIQHIGTIHYRGHATGAPHVHHFGDTAGLETGAIGQCPCGQWAEYRELPHATTTTHGRAWHWVKISPREARRLLRKAGVA